MHRCAISYELKESFDFIWISNELGLNGFGLLGMFARTGDGAFQDLVKVGLKILAICRFI